MIVDPSHRISLNHEYENEMINILSQGHNVTNVSNYNDRIFKSRLVEQNKGGHYNYVILGASPVMQMSSEMFNNSRVLNLGVSHGCFKDFIAFYEMTKEFDIAIDTLILGVLPSFFNTTEGNNDWTFNRKYYYSFAGSNENNESFSLRSTLDKMTEYNFGMIKMLFSIAYFKSSIECLINGNIERLKPTDSLLNKGYTYYKDGSMSYSEKFRNNTAAGAEIYANSWRVENEFISKPDVENVRLFEQLVGDCHNRNIKIILLMMPLHPVYYQRVYGSDRITEQEEYIILKNDSLHVLLSGRCAPSLSNYKANDFMDQAHLKREAVGRLINAYIYNSEDKQD